MANTETIVTVTVKFTGVQDILFNNSRTVNPFDPWTQQIKRITSKRKKTEEELYQLLCLQARAACYETEDGLIAYPTECVYQGIRKAAQRFSEGVSVQNGVSQVTELALILLKGKSIKVVDFLPPGGDIRNVDYRPANTGTYTNKKMIMRPRPRVQTGWTMEHVFSLDLQKIDRKNFERATHDAASDGMGDWRARFGKCVAKLTYK